MAVNNVDLWVSAGSFQSPYYRFYTDEAGNNELSELSLNTNNSYTFRRLGGATSHPFYLSDSGFKQASTNQIIITGDGSPSSGITGSQSLTVSFSEEADELTQLLYYCSAHSSMQAQFRLEDSGTQDNSESSNNELLDITPDSIVQPVEERFGALRAQAGNTIFYAFSDDMLANSSLGVAYQNAIQAIDSIIEMDFQRIEDATSPLAQLILREGDLSDMELEDEAEGRTLGVNEPSYSTQTVGTAQYRSNARNTITIDEDAYSEVISNFSSFDVYAQHIAQHEIGHALGLQHPWESGTGELNDYAVSQTMMAYRIDNTLEVATITDVDRQALEQLHGAESSASSTPSVDSSVPVINLVEINATEKNEITDFSTLTIPVQRTGSTDVDATALISLGAYSFYDDAAAEILASALALQQISLPAGLDRTSLDIAIPTGAIGSFDVVLSSPVNAELGLDSITVDMQALEINLAVDELVNQEILAGNETPLLQDQGSEIIYYSLAQDLDPSWATSITSILNELDSVLDLDFAQSQEDLEIASLRFVAADAEASSAELAWSTPQITLDDTIYRGQQEVVIALPFPAQSAAPSSNEEASLLAAMLRSLGMEDPTDERDGDSYTLTRVLPRDSALFNQLGSQPFAAGLQPIDRQALALLHPLEDDTSAGGDPRNGAPIDTTRPILSMELDPSQSGQLEHTGTSRFHFTLTRSGNTQMESRALLYAASAQVAPGVVPFSTQEVVLAPGTEEVPLSIELPNGSLGSLTLSLEPLTSAEADATYSFNNEQLSSAESQLIAIDDGDVTFSISGEPRVGQTLALELIEDDLDGTDNSSFQHQWQAHHNGTWNDISAATSHQFIPSSAFSNQELRVITRYVDDQGFDETIISDSIIVGEELLPPSLQINFHQDGLAVLPGGKTSATLQLSSSTPAQQLGGLSLVVPFNAELLELTPIDLSTSDLAQGLNVEIQDDTGDVDADPSTNRLVQISWGSNASSLANTQPQNIVDLEFTASDTNRFSSLSLIPIAAQDHALQGVDITGVGSAAAITPFSLDVDADGDITALSDGLMIIRKLFGGAFSGDALTDKARNGTSALLNTQQIHDFITAGMSPLDGQTHALLDVDRDGQVGALSDGLMIIRHLFDGAFSGGALIDKAISPDSPYYEQADAWQSVAANIDQLKTFGLN